MLAVGAGEGVLSKQRHPVAKTTAPPPATVNSRKHSFPRLYQVSTSYKWEFPKIRGPYLGAPYNKDPTMSGTILGSPIIGNPQVSAGFWSEGCRVWFLVLCGLRV